MRRCFTSLRQSKCRTIECRLRPVQWQEAWNRCWTASALSANVSQVADGFNTISKLGCFRAIFCWTWRESGRPVLPWSPAEATDAASHASHCRRRVCVPIQQDSAPAHRARETVQLLQQQTPEFISPDLWLPNSPDLNPVDYRILGLMRERVCRHQSTETASHRLLVKSVSGRHRQRNWPVASATPSVCEGQGTPLWASSVLKQAPSRATRNTYRTFARLLNSTQNSIISTLQFLGE